nr:hypothetical protein [uncultured Faecalimonas sp.]
MELSDLELKLPYMTRYERKREESAENKKDRNIAEQIWEIWLVDISV